MSKKPYRGKRTDNGEWVKGYYVHLREDYYKEREVYRIYTGEAVALDGEYYTEYREVDPATVGRYTGFEDDDKTEIYEGDKVELRGFRNTDDKWQSLIGTVVLENGTWKIVYYDGSCASLWYVRKYRKLKVVGNIHDGILPEEPGIPASLSEHIMSRFERRQ